VTTDIAGQVNTSGCRRSRSPRWELRAFNITLIFSLARYAQVIEAYLTGLETFDRPGR
jgi:hypothetical protein